MKKLTQLLTLSLLSLSAIAFTSCTATRASSEENTTTPMKSLEIKSEITAITLDRIADSKQVDLPKADLQKISSLLQKASYDKDWNDKDMMIKMQAPDYMLSISMANGTMTNAMIWEENNKVKYENVWYVFTNSKDAKKVIEILSSY